MRLRLFVIVFLFFVSSQSQAHFMLVTPFAVVRGEANGKGAPPCGPDAAAAANPTPVQGGHALQISANESVTPHRGHYRIALSINSRSELPPDPVVYDKNKNILDPSKFPPANSDTSAIEMPPVFPVLADDLWDHPLKPMVFTGEVMLPNVNCDRCTLQVIEFMADHPANPGGGYFYHHCADLKITADPALPPFGADGGATDTAVGGADASGGDVTAGASGGAAGTDAAQPGSGGASGGSGGQPGSGGAIAVDAAAATGGKSGAGGSTGPGSSGGGCAVGGSRSGPPPATLLVLLLGVAAIRRVRRR